MSERLKKVLAKLECPQASLARTLGLSTAAVSQLVNKGVWPKRNPQAVKDALHNYLLAQGVAKASVLAIFTELEAISQPQETDQEHPMLRKQTLKPQAKRHFGIPCELFSDELGSVEDVFYSPDIRYVRETLYHTAKHVGFLGVYGESGSGKSTLRRDLISRLKGEDAPVIVIEPYILGMEDNDKTGKTLKALHIAEAILYTVAPTQKCQSSPEARFRQVHKVLRDSYNAGNRHVLIIEEAHSLSPSVLKHLKRFFELEDGMHRLLSIILFGQQELLDKLSESTTELREVAQRIELLELRPLDDVEGYVRHRCDRAGVAFDKLFTAEAFPALSERLSGPSARGAQNTGSSKLFPLLVGNTLTKAINLAASLGETKITADIVRSA